jgi:hypothetical protein
VPAAEVINFMATDLPPPPPVPAAPKPAPEARAILDLMTAAELQVVAAPAEPEATSPFAEAVAAAAANPAAYAALAAAAAVAAAAATAPTDPADPAAAAAAAAAAAKARGAAAAAAAFAAPPTSAGLGGEAELDVDGDEELEEVFESYRPAWLGVELRRRAQGVGRRA